MFQTGSDIRSNIKSATIGLQPFGAKQEQYMTPMPQQQMMTPMPTAPKPTLQQNIPVQNLGGISGITKPLIGTDVARPVGAEKTQLSNFPQEVKQQIKQETKPNIFFSNKGRIDEVKPQIDMDQALNDLSQDMMNVVREGRVPEIAKLKELYPEFSNIDDTVLEDLTADIGNLVRDGRQLDMNRLKELYPELNIDLTTKRKQFWQDNPKLDKGLSAIEQYEGIGGPIIRGLATYIRGLSEGGSQVGEAVLNLEKRGKGDIQDSDKGMNLLKGYVAEQLFREKYGMSYDKKTPGHDEKINEIINNIEQEDLYKKELSRIQGEQKTIDDKKPQEDVLDILMGGSQVAVSMFAPQLSVGMNVGAQTDAGMTVLQNFVGVLEKGGEIVNMLPGLRDYRESLPEERREEFDTFVGGTVFGLVVGLKGKGNIIKNPKKFVMDNINPIDVIDNFQSNIFGTPKMVVGGIQGAKSVVKNVVKKTTAEVDNIDRLIASTNDLDPATVSKFRQKPDLMKAIDEGKITKDGVKQELISISESADATRGEIGKQYSELYKSKNIFDSKEIMNEIDTNLRSKGVIFDSEGKIVDFDMTNKAVSNTPVGELNLIKSEYNSLKTTLKNNPELSVEAMHNIKKRLNNTQYVEGVQKKTSPILRTLGENINKRLKSEVPGWKEVDDLFSSRANQARELYDLIFTKKGEFKGTLKALLGERQYARLQELEKAYPGLTEKLEGLRAYDDFARTLETQKTGAYGRVLRGAGGAGVGATIGYNMGGWLGGVVGGIIGKMITNKISDPNLMKSILFKGVEATGLEGKLLNNTKLNEKDIKMLNDNIDRIIKNNKKLRVEENIKQKQTQRDLFKSQQIENERINTSLVDRDVNMMSTTKGIPTNPKVDDLKIGAEVDVMGKPTTKGLQPKKAPPKLPTKTSGLKVKTNSIGDIENTKGVKKEVIKPAGGKLEIEKYSIGDGIYDTVELKIQKHSNGEPTSYSVNYGNSSWQQMSKSEAISEFKKLANTKGGLKAMVKAPEEGLKLKKGEYIRYSDNPLRDTNDLRGGTRYTNKEGADVVLDAMDKKQVSNVVIGGNKISTKKIAPKKPLIVENANLNEGSLSIINAGYEDFIPKKYANIAEEFYISVSETPDNVNKIIQNSLMDAGIDLKQIELALSNKNKFDVAMDLIISKGVKESGYDAIILRNGSAEHIMDFGEQANKKGLKVNK